MNVRASLLLAFIVSFSLLPVGLYADEQKSSSPPELASYYFVLLTRGPEWTAEKTPATEKIQAAHLANITKLQIESAPAVQAGRLTNEIHPWATRKGMLP
ncbi:MAG: hypothetical protein DMF03_14085 [Verrucomicrobia bacterium]|nr:MAG: hypothetical protein DMF03_14085 [Verrucomicrobiota bacterium]